MQFLRNTGFLIASNASVFFVTFLIQVVYARYYGPDAFGGYSFLLAWFTPIFLLFGMNLQQLIPSISDQKFVPSIIHRAQIASLGVATLLSVVVLCLVGSTHASETLFWVGSLILATKVFETYSLGLHGFWYRDGRFLESSSLRLFRSVAIVVTLLTVTQFVRNPHWTLAMPLVCYLGFMFIEARAVRTHVSVDGTLSQLEFLQLGCYSGFASFFDSLIALTPRIYLGVQNQLADIASFTAVISLASLPALIVNPLGNVGIGYFRRCSNRQASMLLLAMLYGTCLTIGIISYFASTWLGSELLTLVYGAEFTTAGPHLPAACMATMLWFLSGMNGCYLQARMRYRQQFLATLLGVAATFLGPWLTLEFDSSVGLALMAYTLGMVARFVVSGAFVIHDLTTMEKLGPLNNLEMVHDRPIAG